MLSRPEDARARPGDVLRSDDDYELVYNIATDHHVYEWVIRAQRLVDSALRQLEVVTLAERNDARFLISAKITRDALGYRPSQAQALLSLGRPAGIFTEVAIASALSDFRKAVQGEIGNDPNVARDRLSKSRIFADSFLA